MGKHLAALEGESLRNNEEEGIYLHRPRRDKFVEPQIWRATPEVS